MLLKIENLPPISLFSSIVFIDYQIIDYEYERESYLITKYVNENAKGVNDYRGNKYVQIVEMEKSWPKLPPLGENNKITFYMVTDYWKDTGTPADILHANQLLLEDLTSYNHGEIEEDVNISGNVMIGKNSIIKSGVIIKGPIIIGENCIIEGNAELGPNISIGNNSKLSGCKIKNSIIMDEAEIRCNQKIHNSIIATNSRILSSDEEKTLLLGEGTKITL